MASGAGTTDAAVGGSRRGRSSAPIEPPKRGSTTETTVARMHASGRRLVMPAILVLAVCGGAGYLSGRLTQPWERIAIPVGAVALVVLVGVIPFLVWLSRVYVITTRRIVLRSGFFVRSRQEVLLTRGFDVTLRRGPLQALAGSGDILIDTGAAEPVVLRDVPAAAQVQAALGDLMEYSTNVVGTKRQQQIAATRRPFDP
ncbi:MAG TPA: PH domain-containing protein [Naasia sp.]|jgi:membrane protein YdbS with pleckstrin-like domain